MGCASCAQKYRRYVSNGTVSARRRELAAARAAARKFKPGGSIVVSEKNASVQVQEQPVSGVVIPNNEIAVEPATGIAISVIKTGESPEKSLGDTLPKPLTVEQGLGQGD